MDSTIDRLISTATAGSSAPPLTGGGGSSFLPSLTWTGPRPGYYFGTSAQGTGYHLDLDPAATGGSDAADGPARKRARLEANADADGGSGKTIRFGADSTHTIPPRQQQRPKKKTGEELLAEAEARLEADQSASTFGSATAAALTLTPAGIRQACTHLTKCLTRNEMDRAQHPDDPTQFMESEVGLNSAIESMKDVAAAVHLYPTLVSTNNGEVVTHLVGLLGHENGDVAASVLGVLGEWTDPDLLLTATVGGGGGGENDEEATEDPTAHALHVGGLANAVLSAPGMLDLLVSNLKRYDEEVEEEREGIEQGLTVVENCLDLDRAGALRLAHRHQRQRDGDGARSKSSEGEGGDSDVGDGDSNKREYQSVVRRILRSTPLLAYLLQRVSNSSSDSSIRLHASELLSSILQHDDARLCAADISALPPLRSAFDDDTGDDGDASGNKRPLSDDASAKVDGMECLLQSIAPYRKRDPQTAEEVEILENIYDALAACLQNAANVRAFVDGQGVELMLRCLRSGGHGGCGALKVLSFACSGPSLPTESETAYQRACETLVEAGGLKQIFPLFMGRSSAVPNPAPCSDAGRGLALARKKTEDGDGDKKQKKRKKKADAARKEWLREVEGNAIRILYELTRHLDDASPNESKNRLLAKFLEGDCVSSRLEFLKCFAFALMI